MIEQVQLGKYEIPDLPFIRLRFVAEALESALLSEYKMSMLRGALGHALRQGHCRNPEQKDCFVCPHHKNCLYYRFFRLKIEDEPLPQRDIGKDAIRPYIFECNSNRREFFIGDKLVFDMTLLGSCFELKSIIHAVRKMLLTGLTKRCHPFLLSAVKVQREFDNEQSWKDIYRYPGKSINTAITETHLQLKEFTSRDAVIHFLTRTQFNINNDEYENGKSKKIFNTEFTFKQYIEKLLNRHLELLWFYHDPSLVEWEYATFLHSAESVHLKNQPFEWKESWVRESTSQKIHLKLDGFEGSMHIHGPIRPYEKLLNYSRVWHVGRETAFGLGKVGLEIIH